MKTSHAGPTPNKPYTVRVAQALIWLEFAAIIVLYGTGLNFVMAATTSAVATGDSAVQVLLYGGPERWILVLTSVAVTASLPVIAVRLGRRSGSAVGAAWYALAFVPFCMYVWVVARAYMATFPDNPEFFIGAGAMLLVCASLPTAILLCLASRSSRAWFGWRPEVAIPAQARAQPELVAAAPVR